MGRTLLNRVLRSINQRYSTNTFPQVGGWRSLPHAGPQRRDQHAQGQTQLDEKHEHRHGRPGHGLANMAEDIKPNRRRRVVRLCRLDAVSRCWCARPGRSAPMAKNNAGP